MLVIYRGENMLKKRVKIYDDNWNLEQDFYVDVLIEQEKIQKEQEQLIKDYLYSNRLLRLLGTLIYKVVRLCSI